MKSICYHSALAERLSPSDGLWLLLNSMVDVLKKQPTFAAIEAMTALVLSLQSEVGVDFSVRLCGSNISVKDEGIWLAILLSVTLRLKWEILQIPVEVLHASERAVEAFYQEWVQVPQSYEKMLHIVDSVSDMRDV